MDTPTSHLQLPQWETSDDFDVVEVSGALATIDKKLTPTACTTATRPTGLDRFDGRIVYDSDIDKYIRWSAVAGSWNSYHFGGVEFPTIPLTIANGTGVTVQNVYLTHKNGICQIYINWKRTTAISAGDTSNFNVAVIPDPWKPRIPTALTSSGAGPASTYYVDNNSGQIVLCSCAAAVAANAPMSCTGTYILK